jgi:hypothetical protein
MELKVEELPQEQPYPNYWSGTAEPAVNKKTSKKVSYNDILSSLNMVVSKGVLQFANPTTPPPPVMQTTMTSPHTPIQNSYIHNKYFKDYLEPNAAPIQNKPPTRAEYLKYLQNQQQIARVKSKKLLFNTQHIAVSQTQNLRDLNKMFVTPYRKK